MSGSAGTTSNTKRSGSSSVPAAPVKRNRSDYSAGSSQNDVVDFSGRFDRIDRAALVPKPTRSIPIWLGGSSEAAYDRAARLADGFIFIGGDIDHTIDAWTRLRDRVRSLGRSVEEFGAEYVVRPQNPPGDLTAEIDAWRQAGGTHLSVVTMGLGFDAVDGHVGYLASVANALGLS